MVKLTEPEATYRIYAFYVYRGGDEFVYRQLVYELIPNIFAVFIDVVEGNAEEFSKFKPCIHFRFHLRCFRGI